MSNYTQNGSRGNDKPIQTGMPSKKVTSDSNPELRRSTRLATAKKNSAHGVVIPSTSNYRESVAIPLNLMDVDIPSNTNTQL